MQKIRFVEGLNIIKGRPGGGKTYRTLYTLAKSRKLRPALIVTPLRVLRDWSVKMLRGFGARAIALRSRDEICPSAKAKAKQLLARLKQVLKWEKIDFVYPALMDIVCKNCPKKRNCPYKEQFKLLDKFDYVAITYRMLPSVIWRNFEVIYYDEVETYIDAVNMFVEANIIRELKDMGLKVERYFKKFKDPIAEIFPQLNLPKYVYVPKLSVVNKPYTIVSTATMLQAFYAIIKGEVEVGKEIFIPTPPPKDVYIGLHTPTSYVRDNYLVAVVNYLYKRVSHPIGIISPNKRLTFELSKLPNVSSDLLDTYPNTSAKIIVVTTRGRWFRGVNVDDRRIVIFGWQYQTPMGYPIMNPELRMKLRDDERDRLSMEMVYATNVQALFRFLRRPANEHIVITVNYPLTMSSLNWFMPYYYKQIRKEQAKNIEMAVEILWRYLNV